MSVTMRWDSERDVDDYRGEVCMELRGMGRGDLADEVGAWSDEQIAEEFQGTSPLQAAQEMDAGYPPPDPTRYRLTAPDGTPIAYVIERVEQLVEVNPSGFTHHHDGSYNYESLWVVETFHENCEPLKTSGSIVVQDEDRNEWLIRDCVHEPLDDEEDAS